MIPQYFLFMTMLNMTAYCSVVTSQWFWCHDNDEFWHYNRHCTLRILISESFFVTLKSWHNIQVCCHNAECSCHSSEICHHSALFCLQNVKFWSCNSPFDNMFWQYHTLLLRYCYWNMMQSYTLVSQYFIISPGVKFCLHNAQIIKRTKGKISFSFHYG